MDLRAEAFDRLGELRYVATEKRLRAALDGVTVLDTTRALLVWEPRRVVPTYAVPESDLRLTFTEHETAPLPELLGPVLPPMHPEWHTTPGRSLHLDGHGEVAFRPNDADLAGYVVVHWEPFDWVEEDEPVIGHAHDPFSRIDIRRSDRHVRVLLGEEMVAESRRPVALFETGLPVRWYLPREDVRTDLLTGSDTHSTCAYKGVASYLSADGAPDVAWYYPDPLPEVEQIRDLLCFWGDAQVLLDGAPITVTMPGED